MLELIINKEKDKKTIVLVENGRLLEQYEDNKDTERNEGNIYIAKVKDLISGMQAAFVDIGTNKNAFIHLKDVLPKIDETKQKQEEISISKVIKPGDILLVQIKKDSNEKKGARVSTHISLPGYFLVLMPNTNIITISQKIKDLEEKDRLINLVKANLPKNYGAIIRTSAVRKKIRDNTGYKRYSVIMGKNTRKIQKRKK